MVITIVYKYHFENEFYNVHSLIINLKSFDSKGIKSLKGYETRSNETLK